MEAVSLLCMGNTASLATTTFDQFWISGFCTAARPFRTFGDPASTPALLSERYGFITCYCLYACTQVIMCVLVKKPSKIADSLKARVFTNSKTKALMWLLTRLSWCDGRAAVTQMVEQLCGDYKGSNSIPSPWARYRAPHCSATSWICVHGDTAAAPCKVVTEKCILFCPARFMVAAGTTDAALIVAIIIFVVITHVHADTRRQGSFVQTQYWGKEFPARD